MSDHATDGRLVCTRCGTLTPAHMAVMRRGEVICYDCCLYSHVPAYVAYEGQRASYQRAEHYELFTAPVDSLRWYDSGDPGGVSDPHVNATRLPRTGCDLLDMHLPTLAAQMGME